MVLKRLEEALNDGDHIYAVIKGCGLNNDGAAKVGFTAPSMDGQAEAVATRWPRQDSIRPHLLCRVPRHRHPDRGSN